MLYRPFLPDKKGEFGLGGSRLSHYDIRAEGALPPSTTVIARVKNGPVQFTYVFNVHIQSKLL